MEGKIQRATRRAETSSFRAIDGYWRHIFFATIALQLIPGLGHNPSTSKDVGENNPPSKSNGNSGREILVICIGLIAFVALSVVIFKLWQKKKREEQHARLLRLFEEDDELELELGLRD
ncbi:hypothetical protein HPP92_002677 [Vanilla planifolia]|uniref:Uncharacterized protein n=1 Tax=Vanilla planifolia TaxID=51239 RepID=A0A835S0R4_VANPL|nr:hypothetical protein HPP92_002677 [Vanilla planifolia]